MIARLFTPGRLALGLFTLALLALPAGAQYEEDELTYELCAECHDEGESFAASPHGRAMAARDPAILERSCAACHRPSVEHPEDPMPENVKRRPSAEACSECHGASAGGLFLATPGHQRHDIGCYDCHAVGHVDPESEAAAPIEHLLTAEPFELCGGCHREQASAARRPFAHRDGGEPFACVNCHSVHSLPRVGRLLAGGNGGACLDCHSEKAGPFVFPHPPREVDGCLGCHQPHGSTNPRMLTRRTSLSLCLECHTGVPAFHDLTSARFRVCQSCHFAVHGSNRDPRLFDE